MSCLFCQIVSTEIPTEFIYEDENFIAINDIHPKAPTHILIITKKHIPSIKDLVPEDEPLIGKMFGVARDLAAEKNLPGYKLIFNVGEIGGQMVPHLHLHLLGGWGEKQEE